MSLEVLINIMSENSNIEGLYVCYSKDLKLTLSSRKELNTLLQIYLEIGKVGDGYCFRLNNNK